MKPKTLKFIVVCTVAGLWASLFMAWHDIIVRSYLKNAPVCVNVNYYYEGAFEVIIGAILLGLGLFSIVYVMKK